MNLHPAALTRAATHLAAPLYYRSLCAMRVPALHRRLHGGGLILCYHDIVGPEEPAARDRGLHLPYAAFERQVRWLIDRYTVVALSELVDRLTRGLSVRRLAAITFDDGYLGVFSHAIPLLRRLRVPATVFIVSAAVDRESGFWWDLPDSSDRQAFPAARGADSRLPATCCAAGWTMIRAHLFEGLDIGAHTISHRALPTLDGDDLEREIRRPADDIERELNVRAEHFAYPYGAWDARIRAHVRAAGYRAAFTLDAGLNRLLADPWSLRRMNVPASISDAAFEAWTAGLMPSGRVRTS